MDRQEFVAYLDQLIEGHKTMLRALLGLRAKVLAQPISDPPETLVSRLTPVEALQLDGHALKMVRDNHIHFAEQLTQLTAKELGAGRWIGPKVIEAVGRQLEAHNLSFASEEAYVSESIPMTIQPAILSALRLAGSGPVQGVLPLSTQEAATLLRVFQINERVIERTLNELKEAGALVS